MITLSKIRELDLSAATSDGRHLHLSAASGLVRADSCLYVIADDELHLGVFHSTDTKPGHLIRIFPGELPDSNPQRKKRKPDLETLMRLPAFAEYSYGALFALGSGAKRNRRLGALLALDAQGAANDHPRVIDLAKLFSALGDHFPALNIEGGIVSGDELCLLQRGNKRSGRNALIRFHLSPLLDMLGSDAGIARVAPFAVHPVDLGSISGTPLGFTDGAALPNGDIVFSAVAEDTEDTYNDGACVGAAIGILDKGGNLRCLHRLDQPYKIEGVDASVEGGVIRLLLVTDADDAGIPASLFQLPWHRYEKFASIDRWNDSVRRTTHNVCDCANLFDRLRAGFSIESDTHHRALPASERG